MSATKPRFKSGDLTRDGFFYTPYYYIVLEYLFFEENCEYYKVFDFVNGYVRTILINQKEVDYRKIKISELWKG